MNVAHPWVIVSGDFVKTGGMDRANYALADYLAARIGRQVHLVAYRVDDPLASHPNVVWHRVHKPLNSYTLAEPILMRLGRRVATSLTQDPTRAAPTVVVNGGNCCWGDICWIQAVHAAWPRRDVHAPWRFRVRAAWAKARARRREHRVARNARLVITNSCAARRQIVERIGVAQARTRTVYYGIDAQTFRPATRDERVGARSRLGMAGDRPAVAFIGALGHDRNKGFDVLFEGFVRLCAQAHWDVDLVAAGGGAEVEYWRQRAADLGLAQRIRMLGFVRGGQDVLRAADLLVSPTHYDAYGLGVHEAICCGIPAIVSRSAGVAERYPSDLAGELLLDDPSDVDELVRRLRAWRADVEGWKRRIRPFSDQLRARSWDDMAAEIVAIAEADDSPRNRPL